MTHPSLPLSHLSATTESLTQPAVGKRTAKGGQAAAGSLPSLADKASKRWGELLAGSSWAFPFPGECPSACQHTQHIRHIGWRERHSTTLPPNQPTWGTPSVQESKPAAAADERSQELAALKERLQQMTNRMGQMEQKVIQYGREQRQLQQPSLEPNWCCKPSTPTAMSSQAHSC